jgi:hypothetical protein
LAFGLALFAILSPGCAQQGAGGSLGGDPEALSILRSVWERDQGIPTMAVRGDVAYSKGTERFHFRFELISKSPSDFLFTIMDPMGSPAYRILSDGTGLRALDYRQRIFYQGAATDRPLETFLPLPIGSGDFLALIAGRMPQEPVSARSEGSLAADQKVATLSFRTGSASEPGPWRAQLTGGPGFRPEDGPTLLQLSRGARTTPDFLVRYDKRSPYPREDTGGMVQFPDGLNAVWKGSPDLMIRATYNEVRLGFAMPLGVLALERPEGFETRFL